MFRVPVRLAAAFLAVAVMIEFGAIAADAAPRFNAGSRGSRTFSAPPPTATAPNAARPIERSMTQPGQVGTTSMPAAAGGFFNRPGLLGGLAAGFLGAGLFGMLFGNGLLGGLGGFASFLGLILQIGIVAMIAMFAWHWWQRRSQPAAAFAGGRTLREVRSNERPPYANFGGVGGSSPAPASNVPIEVKPEDFDAFEQILGQVLTAYGAEDLAALRGNMTPEMLSYYCEE